jgi:thymidylate synthase ThyX
VKGFFFFWIPLTLQENPMGFEVKIIKRSISEQGMPLVTAQFKYPRFIHAEFMTHREFSRNASSSRAIPVKKMIEQVRNDPAMPIHWGANQAGMQAHAELSPARIYECQQMWCEAAGHAADIAEAMEYAGLHKQVANRVLEPYQWMHVIATTCNTSNFFGLRRHRDAQPEIKLVADLWHEALEQTPAELVKEGEWHLPYITQADVENVVTYLMVGRITRDMPPMHQRFDLLAKISAARCARVSYLTHDGQTPTIDKDLELFERLAGSMPLHASPLEHQATPDHLYNGLVNQWATPQEHGNLIGWRQFRKMLPGEYIH